MCIEVDEIEPTELLWTVSHILRTDGQWDLTRLQTVLPDRVVQQIQLYCRSLDPGNLDTLTWKGNAEGIVTAKSLYRFLIKQENTRVTRKWEWVWKLNCPQKIRFFVWLLLHERIPVNAYRSHISIPCNILCDRC